MVQNLGGGVLLALFIQARARTWAGPLGLVDGDFDIRVYYRFKCRTTQEIVGKIGIGMIVFKGQGQPGQLVVTAIQLGNVVVWVVMRQDKLG